VNDDLGNWTLPAAIETEYDGIDVMANCNVQDLVESFIKSSSAPRVVRALVAAMVLVVAMM
jgi:hypothetical protein